MKYLLLVLFLFCAANAPAQSTNKLYIGGTPLDSIQVTYLSFSFYKCRISETGKREYQTLVMMRGLNPAIPPRNWTRLCYCEQENPMVPQFALRRQDGSYVTFEDHAQILNLLYEAGWEYVDAVLSVSNIYMERLNSSTDYIIKRRE